MGTVSNSFHPPGMVDGKSVVSYYIGAMVVPFEESRNDFMFNLISSPIPAVSYIL